MYDHCEMGCLFVIKPSKLKKLAYEPAPSVMLQDSILDRIDLIHGTFDITISMQQSRKECWQQYFE
jgi:hypothetical protein